MLRLGLRRESGRVGRQKREWRLIVPPVLGKIEMHAADEMPRGIPLLKERLNRLLRFGELGSKRYGSLSPERFQNRSREVLSAGHWRRGGRERFELAQRGRRDGRVVSRNIGMGTDGRDQLRSEVTPVAHVRGQRGPDLAGTKLEQSVTRAATEGELEPAQGRGGGRRTSSVTLNSRWLRGVSESDAMFSGSIGGATPP